MNPSERCTDHEFLRRAHMDLLGLLPTETEARDFVADTSPDKRAQLVDRLLERPEFAEFWALKWSDLLRNEEKRLDRKGVQVFHHWIRDSLQQNKPLDQFVREIVAARGSTYRNPPANYYRSLRDPIDRAEATAQLFLGTRLQCAKCHNHPFDRWTQNDYYDWANVFAGVRYKVLANKRRDRYDKNAFIGEQIVWVSDGGSVKNPKTGKPAASRFLDMSGMETDPGGSEPGTRASARPAAGRDPLLSLADWLTRADNPLFGRTQVNRVWYHLMGQGIVVPIDDLRPTNPPTNPALLDALTRDFVDHGFDLRHLIRRIMLSETYQLSSRPNETNAGDTMNFSHAIVRRLAAESLLDAVNQVVGVPASLKGYPRGMRATQVPGVGAVHNRKSSVTEGDRFLRLFGKPERLLTCECERSDEATMGQAFQLISGRYLQDALTARENRIGGLLASKATDDDILDTLYWTALSRPPSDRERAAHLERLSQADNRREALEDLLWALVNAKEFVLRK